MQTNGTVVMTSEQKPAKALEAAEKFATEKLPSYKYKSVEWDALVCGYLAGFESGSQALTERENLITDLMAALEKYENIVSEYRSGGDEWAARETLTAAKATMKGWQR